MNPLASLILSAAADRDAAAKAVTRELEESRARHELARQERERLAAVSERDYVLTEILFGLGGGARLGLPSLPHRPLG